jgi:FkbM family methyltransferase
MRAFLKAWEKALAAALPSALYFRLQDFVRPRLDHRVSGRGRTVRARGTSYEVEWANGTRFRFPHKLRYCRYMHPNGLEHILDQMLAKYQDGPVQIESGDVVFEVGGNAGEFTLAALRKGAKVTTAEPDSNAFDCLVCNAPEARALALAVGDRDGTAVINLSTAGADSSLINASSKKAIVPIRTIATLMPDGADFLKIEAEGFEPEVLKGAVPVLDRVRKIAIDCGPERHGKPTFEECEAILNGRFRTWRKGHILFAHK